MGRSELHRTESLLTQALRNRLKIMAWPNSPEVPHWQEEVPLFQLDAARAFQDSMRQRLDLALIYRRARHRFPAEIDGQPPLPLPETCLVALDDLLTEPQNVRSCNLRITRALRRQFVGSDARWRKLMLPLCLTLSLLVCCRAAAADSPVAPAPAECLNVLVHADRGWFVFFDSDSAALTPRATVIPKELAAGFLEDHGRIVVLNGNTDGVETSPEDRDLGVRRAKAVAAALEQAGIH